MSRKFSRQLSLHCESPPLQVRRPSLKKQLSEDIPRGDDDLGIRISLSAKSRTHNVDAPPGIKVAWGEDKLQDDILTTNKYKEVRRPVKTAKSDVKDSILCPKPDLTDRLRQAWTDKEKSKQNLNIFLAPNSPEIYQDEEVQTPKIIPHLQPDIHEVDLKSIFQKAIRKNTRSNVTSTYSPTRTEERDGRSAVVIVPIIERSKPLVVPRPDEAEESCEEEKSINVVIRPSTAASKRELFQKRTNSAFHSSIKSDSFRPPLVRASSVPCKPDAKSKFLATKRRLKSAKKKDKQCPLEDDGNDGSKKADIVTMVSLVSPSGSDEEEVTVEAPKAVSPKKTNVAKKDEHAKTFSLRKAVKSVSFQQSSIHAVRSFSASFPSRRSSVATTVLLGSAAKKLNGHLQRGHERRPAAPADDEQVGPKRRLVRSSSTSLEQPQESKMEEPEKVEMIVQETKPEESVAEKQVDTQTPKEKECWEMYCKMNERGLTISFDTILRGMLTPTEYRLRRKIQEAVDDNCR